MSLYFIDSYLSIILGIPTSIEGDELFEPVVSTFALWNSNPVSVHAVRLGQEPVERSHKTMDAVACSEAAPAAWSLFEDARLAYCGLQHTIWRHNQRRVRLRRSGAMVDEVASIVLRDATLKHLDTWAARLNELIVDCASQAAQLGPDDESDVLPLAAYRGSENDAGKERWRGTPLSRAMAQGYECTILYHLLSMRLCMHPALFGAGAGLWQPWSRMGTAMTFSAAEERELQEWALSSDGRRALWHGVATHKFVEHEGMRHGYPRAQRGHLEDAAVSTSITIVGRWIKHNTAQAACDLTGERHELVEMGGPWEQADVNMNPAGLLRQVSVCTCYLERWLGQWQAEAPQAHAQDFVDGSLTRQEWL